MIQIYKQYATWFHIVLSYSLIFKLSEYEPMFEEKTVVAVLTGGNVSPDELKNILWKFDYICIFKEKEKSTNITVVIDNR